MAQHVFVLYFYAVFWMGTCTPVFTSVNSIFPFKNSLFLKEVTKSVDFRVWVLDCLRNTNIDQLEVPTRTLQRNKL